MHHHTSLQIKHLLLQKLGIALYELRHLLENHLVLENHSDVSQHFPFQSVERENSLEDVLIVQQDLEVLVLSFDEIQDRLLELLIDWQIHNFIQAIDLIRILAFASLHQGHFNDVFIEILK